MYILFLNLTISCNPVHSFNYNCVLLITNDPDNITKQKPFRVPNKSANSECLVSVSVRSADVTRI